MLVKATARLLVPHHVRKRLTLIFVVIAACVLPTRQQTATKPFSVVWNYPDSKCAVRNVDLGLTKYGITRNPGGTFLGGEVSTMYVSSGYGLWPHLANNDPNRPINGGVPQLVNLTAHLSKMVAGIQNFMNKNSDGYGVFDQEMWRPLYDLNWGSKTCYRTASNQAALRQHPNFTAAQAKEEGIRQFNAGSREFLVKSLQAAQAVRPGMHWGFYSYPYRWNTNTVQTNDRLKWLYEAASGYFPSIYIKQIRDITPANAELKVKRAIVESLRVKARFGRPDVHVAPYVVVQNGINVFFTEKELYYAIGLPADMGVDAVIIWGSSRLFNPQPLMRCNSIKAYVHDTLGPYVQKTMERIANCTNSLCNGRGRCIRRDIVKQFPFIQKMHANIQVPNRQARSVAADVKEGSEGGENSFQYPYYGNMESEGPEDMMDYIDASSTGSSAYQPTQASSWYDAWRQAASYSVDSSSSVSLESYFSRGPAFGSASTDRQGSDNASTLGKYSTENSGSAGASSEDTKTSRRPTATPASKAIVKEPVDGIVTHPKYVIATEATNNIVKQSTDNMVEQTTDSIVKKTTESIASTTKVSSKLQEITTTKAPPTTTTTTKPPSTTPPGVEQFPNFVCQCYSGWDGPYCEDPVA